MSRLQRLSILLAESHRLGLRHCDYVEKVSFNLACEDDELRNYAKVVQSITSLPLSNLHDISVKTYGYAPEESITTSAELLRLVLPSQQITNLSLHFANTHCNSKSTSQEVWPRLITHFKDHLQCIHLHTYDITPATIDAITRCSNIKILIFRELYMNISGMINLLANALPNLQSLTLPAHVGKGVSADMFRHLVTQCPQLRKLRLGIDNTVNDKCLRFVARKARKMVEIELEDCLGIGDDDAWSGEDFGWCGLRRLRLSGATRISPSFVEGVLCICTGLEDVYLSKCEVKAQMLKRGFEMDRGIWKRLVVWV